MTSFKFLAVILGFVPALMLVYQMVKPKYRWTVLLAASYIFFAVNSGELIIFILVSTVSIYLIALGISELKNKCISATEGLGKSESKQVKLRFDRYQKLVLTAGIVINLGILVVLKYSPFIKELINPLISMLGLKANEDVRNFALPIGISFYTLSAISYLIDVYRGTVPADRHLGKVALFLSFFPQIMEGPICRFKDTAADLMSGRGLEYKNICFGFQRIAYGMAKRMLVADRVNNFVDNIYLPGLEQNGATLLVGSIFYTFQLYMDFSGTMDIVLGIAEIFGVHLPENFRRPFFSETISEFWKRWHITLGAFFSDYIFYPVSMSKPLKKITKTLRHKVGNYYGPLLSSSIALLLVWFCNGVWHGSGWKYLFFGFYYFSIILIGNLIEPLKRELFAAIHVNRQCLTLKIYRMLRTAFLFNIGEIFFRADTLDFAFRFIKKIFLDTDFSTLTKLPGLDAKDVVLLTIVAVILIVIGYYCEKGINIREKIAELKPVQRWSIYVGIVLIIIVFGGYGYGYSYIDPIYAKF